MIDLEDLATEAIDVHHSGQKPKELTALGRLIVDRGYSSAIEIGTWGGGTSWFLWSLGLSVTTIDDCDEDTLRYQCVNHHGFDFERIPDITYLVGNSRSIHLPSADIVFIDGDHTYAGAKADWQHWRDYVNDGGIIVFHDIIADVPENSSEVKRLFDEIATEYKTTTFIDPTDDAYPHGGFDEDGNRRPWGGIGVVFL